MGAVREVGYLMWTPTPTVALTSQPSRAGGWVARDRLLRMSDRKPKESVSYRFRPAVGVRMLGAACVWLGLTVVLEVVRRGVPALDAPIVTALEWLFVAIFVLVAGGAAWALVGRARLVLDSDGFRNSTTWRRGSVRSARWSDVAGVQRSDGAAGPVFVVELADGRSSLIVSRLLDVPTGTLEHQLQDRLNTAHGYRSL